MTEGALVNKGDVLATYGSSENKPHVLAGSAGTIHLLESVRDGNTFPEGTSLAVIYPVLKAGEKIALTTYVPVSEISGIEKGKKLRFSVLQKIPKPAILTGTITEVDSIPTTLDSGSFFRVQAETTLNESDVSKIKYGLQGKSVVVIGEKTYFDYFKDKLLGNG